ncbi:MAG: cytochrome c oxidase subunit 3 [Dehalococcoidia bacterium]
MTVLPAAQFPPLPTNLRGSRSPGWWGMVLLILTEAVLFSSLIASYFYVQAMSAVWPQGGIEPPALTLPIAMTVILLSSSAPMFLAESGIAAGRQWRLRLGLALCLVLGVIFLALQAVEYRSKEFGLWTNAYGSLFFGITGFHGLHVLVGLVMNVYMQVRAWRGHFTGERHLAIQTTALYWHFVDLVWIAIFLSLYLSPRMFGT